MTQPFMLRLPDELAQRINKHMECLRQLRPGSVVTRAGAIRELLTQALDAVEQQNKSRR